MDQDTFAALLETVRRFVEERLMPLEERVEEEDAVPAEVVQEMRELGLFGLSIPEEYGGIGLSVAEEMEVAMLLGSTSPAFRSVFGTTNGVGSQGIVMDGSEAQRRAYLPRMASGELIASFCLTEPEIGSDAAQLQTRATRTEGGYLLNGTKRYITNAPAAGIFTVMPRTGAPDSGAAGVAAFLLEAGIEGLRLGRKERKMGQRGAHICDVVFEDCFVPAENVIGGEEGQGFRMAMKVLDRGRLHIAALCIGAATRLIREALAYAMDRRQFGKPIAEHQLVQAMLADSRTECAAARALLREAAAKKDRGERTIAEAAMCKYYASEMVGRVADRAVQIFGGAGYIADYPIERFYRDVRIFRIYEGTSQIQQLVIAREMIRDARQ